jgi:hypothetical protein
MGSPAVAIINPHNGPGVARIKAYTDQIARTRALGTKVVCYVHTEYATRPIGDVRADIDLARVLYPELDGIFVDEVSNSAPDYYGAVDACVTANFGPKALTIMNPGTKSPSSTYANADIVMSFEGTPASYRARADVVEPVGRAWHCIHDCTDAEVDEMIALATRRGAGYLYITGPKYSELPAYYERLVAGLK